MCFFMYDFRSLTESEFEAEVEGLPPALSQPPRPAVHFVSSGSAVFALPERLNGTNGALSGPNHISEQCRVHRGSCRSSDGVGVDQARLRVLSLAVAPPFFRNPLIHLR